MMTMVYFGKCEKKQLYVASQNVCYLYVLCKSNYKEKWLYLIATNPIRTRGLYSDCSCRSVVAIARLYSQCCAYISYNKSISGRDESKEGEEVYTVLVSLAPLFLCCAQSQL